VTLPERISWRAAGGDVGIPRAPRLGLGLTEAEVTELVEYLKSL
jgi:hypothetical protein